MESAEAAMSNAELATSLRYIADGLDGRSENDADCAALRLAAQRLEVPVTDEAITAGARWFCENVLRCKWDGIIAGSAVDRGFDPWVFGTCGPNARQDDFRDAVRSIIQAVGLVPTVPVTDAMVERAMLILYRREVTTERVRAALTAALQE